MKMRLRNPAVVILSALMVAFIFHGCKKDSSSSSAGSNIVVTEADAAELITDATSSDLGGAVSQINYAVNVYKNVALTCKQTNVYNFVINNPANSSTVFNYAILSKSTLACDTTVAVQMDFNFTGNGYFKSTHMIARDSVAGGIVVANLANAFAEYAVNLSYTRKGPDTVKTSHTYSMISTLTVESSDIMVDKSTQKIVSGTAAILLITTTTLSPTRSFTFKGLLSFLGANKAKLVLASGAVYNFQWAP